MAIAQQHKHPFVQEQYEALRDRLLFLGQWKRFSLEGDPLQQTHVTLSTLVRRGEQPVVLQVHISPGAYRVESFLFHCVSNDVEVIVFAIQRILQAEP